MTLPRLLDPLLPGRAGLYLSMFAHGLLNHRGFAREHVAFFERLCADLGGVAGKRILDVGCGKSGWLTLLLHSAGAQVTGIDTEVVDPGLRWSKYRRILATNGAERVLRTLAWDVLFATPYYRELARLAPVPLRFEGLDTRAVRGDGMPFDDGTFDAVVSFEVFEHIRDVPAVIADLRRVMKPGGTTYIYVHNWASLSGGHHIAWKYPDTAPSRRVPPWDHLRENRYPLIPSWLNRHRIHEYRAMFESSFEIQHWRTTECEGRELLTPRLAAELPGFTPEELTCKGFIVQARPRAGAAAMARAVGA
ncbi:MAG: class I SAM-dependent methyltransferase [Gammaproteobacteria bacterium]